MDTSSSNNNLHVVFLPLFSISHMIALVQFARLFATRGVRSTIITTVHNALIFKTSVDRDIARGYPIAVKTITFPASEVGLPVGVENLNNVFSQDSEDALCRGMMMIQPDTEQMIRDLAPDCIFSDMFFPLTADLAEELKIPRLLYYPNALFFHSVVHSLKVYAPDANKDGGAESFIVPNLPDQITLKMSQVSDESKPNTPLGKVIDVIHQSEKRSYGIVHHTFYELEPAYLGHMKKVKGEKIWPIGPLSQFFRDEECKSLVSSADKHTCLSWLDNQKPKSVIYVCFGSAVILPEAHITEIALALEECKQPFIWVLRKKPGEEVTGFPQGFEERIEKENKGLIITTWAPQMEILGHPSIQVFFSHCGWGSVLEAVVSGVPLVTWPFYADQFYNEKLVVELLGIGVGVGAEVWNLSSANITSPAIGKRSIVEALEKFTYGSSIAETITNNLKEVTMKAKQAVQEGGSSFNYLTDLIEDLKAFKFSQKT